MPYKSNADLPKAIRDKYGSCASAFRGAFNSTYSKTGNESRSFAAAHAAAQRCQGKESSMTLDTATAETGLSDILGPRFNIVTKALSGGPDEAGKRRFRATASSTISDLGGDEITLPALQKMAQKFREGLTIYMDHDWKHVHSAFGLTDTAEIVQRGVDSKGAAVWDLDIGGVVNVPNERAVQLADSIDGGYVKMGASITAIVREHTRKKQGGLIISDLDVLEASIVGVPQNQRSWAQKAAMAIKSFHPTEEELMDDEMQADSDEPILKTIGDQIITAGEAGPETVQIIEKASCPSCGGSKGEPAGDCKNEFHNTGDTDNDGDNPAAGDDPDHDGKSADLDAVAITKDIATGGQESPAETPETAPEAENEDADPVEQKAFDFDAADVLTLVKRARDLAEAVADRDAQIETLTKERDALANENKEAAKVIEKVLALPLRPKAVAIVSDLNRHLPEFLAPEVRDFLSKSAGGNE